MLSNEAPLRIILDSNALISNWRALNARSKNAAAGAAVKANGYGVGAVDVVTRLSKAGCRDYFVAHWAEAEEIAQIVPANQISVLNGVTPKDIKIAKRIGAVPVLNTPEQVQLWQSVNGGRCHLMIDSGMNRLGFGPDQLAQIDLSTLEIDILMSHLASADDVSPQNARQLKSFTQYANGILARRKSLCNGAGIMLGDDYHFDLTRPGLALYGGVPRDDMADFIISVVQLQAEILQIRKLPVGSCIGYNATYKTDRETFVATAAIGYADGYPRGMSNTGMFRFQNIDLPLIGRVSMDMVTLNINPASHIRPGDWVDVDFDLPKMSAQSGLSQYELLTGLGNRADRHWI